MLVNWCDSYVVPGGDSFRIIFSQDDVLEKPGATLSYINSGGKAALQELHSKSKVVENILEIMLH